MNHKVLGKTGAVGMKPLSNVPKESCSKKTEVSNLGERAGGGHRHIRTVCKPFGKVTELRLCFIMMQIATSCVRDKDKNMTKEACTQVVSL